jgi:(2Fe-2S) ferredoxin
LTSSGLPTDVAERLGTLARSIPARVLLIRRTGRSAAQDDSRSVYVGWSGVEGHWLERLVLADLRELLSLDLAPLADGGSVGGRPVLAPLYLVCTNGRHDPCCAEYGRPVALALEQLVGERVWECSHVGGDRFAGNLVCLPDGHFYGHLDPSSALRVVTAHEQGQVVLEHWRGRSTLPFVAQAAEGYVRAAVGLAGRDDVRFRGSRRDGDRHRVRFTLSTGDEVVAVVAVSERTAPAGLTCAGTGRTTPSFELVALER